MSASWQSEMLPLSLPFNLQLVGHPLTAKKIPLLQTLGSLRDPHIHAPKGGEVKCTGPGNLQDGRNGAPD